MLLRLTTALIGGLTACAVMAADFQPVESIRAAAIGALPAGADAEATLDNRPVDLSWIGRRSSVPPLKREVPAEPVSSIAPQLAELPVAPAASVVPAMAEPEPESVLARDAAPEPSELDKTLALTLDIVAMAERYPLLRNAFHPSERN